MYRHILISGGAGFVGSNLAIAFKREFPGTSVTALDNLKRRGSELALGRLISAGVNYHHGDIQNPEDIAEVGSFELLIECSAEASVHSGYESSPSYLLNTNLVGTIHCLEAARQFSADVIFLSTSRVYPIALLRDLPLKIKAQRFDIPERQSGKGWSNHGISESFSLDGARSLYGATKLASELLLTEYNEMYKLRTIVNRCGVLAGPWQMGKVDQGFVALWAARHLYEGELSYIGFGGNGHQVRDVLHVADLYELLKLQIRQIDGVNRRTFNVGGGRDNSVSLAELTQLCEMHTGHRLKFMRDDRTREADVPWYVTDNSEVLAKFGWRPQCTIESMLEEVFVWLADNRTELEPILRA